MDLRTDEAKRIAYIRLTGSLNRENILNAFDAAVASLFALTVVEPMMVSVFGSGFFVVRDSWNSLF